MTISRRKFIIGASAGAVAAVGGTILTPMIRREGTLVDTTSRAMSVASTEGRLPTSADVVIIGGGIQGVCTALFLAERGLSVVICEKGEIAGEQSGRAYSQIICWQLQAYLQSLILHSKSLWRGMNEKIGADTSYRTQGRVQTYEKEEDLAIARQWMQSAYQSVPNPELLKLRFIEGRELQERIAGARTPWKVGGFEEDAGCVDPENGAPMIARYLKTIGVKIFTHCAVRGIETEGGRVSGVVTEKGAIRASTVVLAGGAWSRLFLGNYGLQLRSLPVYLSQQRLSKIEGGPIGNGHLGNGVFYRLQADGTYATAPRIFTAPIIRDSLTLGWDFLPSLMAGEMDGLPTYLSLNRDLWRSIITPTSWKLDEITPFERIRIAAPTPNIEFCEQSLKRLRKEMPIFEKANVIERWGGMMDIAADLTPVISPVDQYPGLIINTAHCFGMTQAPAAGELVADMITGSPLKVDPKPYSFTRFNT